MPFAETSAAVHDTEDVAVRHFTAIALVLLLVIIVAATVVQLLQATI